MKKSEVTEGVEKVVFQLIAMLNRKEIKVIDGETQQMMRRAVAAYLANISADCLVDGVDYAIHITGNRAQLSVNLSPINEHGLAFFKRHQMCRPNMKLVEVKNG